MISLYDGTVPVDRDGFPVWPGGFRVKDPVVVTSPGNRSMLFANKVTTIERG